MATKLTKSLTREVDAEDGNGRKLLITINADQQTLEFKPKGRTAKASVSLPISKVYGLVKNAQ
jgi:hypothetical protein